MKGFQKTKLAVAMTIAMAVSGCSMLGLSMGETAYSMKPIKIDGELICCELIANNTKDYEGVDFTYEKDKDGAIKMSYKVEGVSATDPATVMQQNQAKMLDLFGALIPVKP